MKKALATVLAVAVVGFASPANASAFTEKVEKQAVDAVKNARAKAKVHKISHSGLCTSFVAQNAANRAAKAKKGSTPAPYASKCGAYKVNFAVTTIKGSHQTGSSAIASGLRSSASKKVILAKTVRSKKAVTFGVGVAKGSDGKTYTSVVVASQ